MGCFNPYNDHEVHNEINISLPMFHILYTDIFYMPTLSANTACFYSEGMDTVTVFISNGDFDILSTLYHEINNDI